MFRKSTQLDKNAINYFTKFLEMTRDTSLAKTSEFMP